MNHQILGLSSRSVWLFRNSLTFRTSRVAHHAPESLTSQAVIQVHEVELVNVCVNVNSCRSVVAVRLPL